MTGEAAAIVAAVLGLLGSAVVLLAYAVSRLRERLARLEQRVDDRNHLPPRYDR